MRRFPAWLPLLLILTACGQKAAATQVFGTVIPFQTQAVTQTATLIPVTPALTEISLPTPTPVSYTVVRGDTLSSIALSHGITLEALLSANPGISPTSLAVGEKLVIPSAGQVISEASPTPAVLTLKQARCWPEATGGLWCFGLLQNDYGETLENISAQFVLVEASGQEITNQAAYGLLDILPPGKSMPLAAHFAAPEQTVARLQVKVLTAIRLLPGDTRYLPVELENTLVRVDASGRSAEVSGRAVLTGTGSAGTLWLLATAYDAAGEVVGVRRWESADALTVQAPVGFDFMVSSLGARITRVEFLVEARP